MGGVYAPRFGLACHPGRVRRTGTAGSLQAQQELDVGTSTELSCDSG